MARSPYRARLSWHHLAAAGFAVTAAWGCFVSLPISAFQAQSVLALDGPLALRAAMARVVSGAIVSKPIVTRAASLLVASDIAVPSPGLAERLGVVAGIGTATSRQGRVADALSAMVRAAPGVVPGTVEINVEAPVADQAARIADAMSDAFLSQQDETIAQARLRREARSASRIEAARLEAFAARQRFAALGGSIVDPVEAKAVAASQTAAAETRLASIRALLATGSPPISDRKDLPPVLAVPQAAYIDLKAQLATQSETLGERHTTIIALKEAVKRAAATLTGEWSRLTKIAEADVAAARSREAALQTSNAPADAIQRAKIGDARRALQLAEEGYARAQKQAGEADDPSFRSVGRASVPNVASGFSSLACAALSALAAILTLSAYWGLAALSVSRRLASPSLVEGLAQRPVEPSHAVDRLAEANALGQVPAPAGRVVLADETLRSRRNVGNPFDRPEPALEASRLADDRPRIESSPHRRAAGSHAPSMRHRGDYEHKPVPNPVMRENVVNDTLMETMRAVLLDIETIGTSYGAVPTIMIAANEAGAGTNAVALALGQAAVEADLRVLLIEAARPQPTLAASVDPHADPILIDLYGRLRIGVRAEMGDGLLMLAPLFQQAERLASGLAKQSATVLIDDVASVFDLILIDGDVASEASAAGWTADAFLRVGATDSNHDDALFRDVFDATPDMLLATILPTNIASQPRQATVGKAPLAHVAMPVSRSIPPRAGAVRPLRRAAPVATPASPRRKVGSRP